MLQIHTLKPARGAKHTRKKVGRGNASGHGTSSGRGGKGQTARSGGGRGNQARSFKRLLQSTPKLRGFTSLAQKPTEITLGQLEKYFAPNDEVTLLVLKEKGLARHSAVRAKILNTGSLSKKLMVVGIKATKAAAEKIVALGGSVQ